MHFKSLFILFFSISFAYSQNLNLSENFNSDTYLNNTNEVMRFQIDESINQFKQFRMAPQPNSFFNVMNFFESSGNDVNELQPPAFRLAYLDWVTSRRSENSSIFLGLQDGFYQFVDKSVDEAGVKKFVDDFFIARSKGFTGYASVVRVGSLVQSGHFLTIFATLDSENNWNVYGIDPLANNSLIPNLVLNPLIHYLFANHSPKTVVAHVIAGAVQQRGLTCGFWAISMARAIASEGNSEGFNKMKRWINEEENPSIEDILEVKSRDAAHVEIDSQKALLFEKNFALRLEKVIDKLASLEGEGDALDKLFVESSVA